MKVMYAITHIGKDGLRTLTFANQGRYHHETQEQAEHVMHAIKPGMERVIGDRINTLEVRPVECYDHGDAMGVYFE